MAKMSLRDISAQGRRVVMRVDFNVPLKNGQVANDKRLRACLPTIEYIVNQGASLVLLSHLGRPKGRVQPQLSLKPCAMALEGLLGCPVQFVDNCIGPEALAASRGLGGGEVLLLENLRFHAGETANDPEFAKELAGLGDLYVNDAFGTAHRAHASTEGITHHLHPSVAGLLMLRELDYLGRILQNPARPFVAILGGAKVSGKIDVIQNLLPKVDRLLIGGGMVFTFLKARGQVIGRSLVEEDRVAMASALLASAGEKIVLPVDCRVSDTFDFTAGRIGALTDVGVEAIPNDAWGLDIGPATLEQFGRILDGARTVVWNGPMGVFEIAATAEGTFEMARQLANMTDKGAITVIGGGDSAAAAEKAGVAGRISHISTGGGASLEFLEGKQLPGVEALTDR